MSYEEADDILVIRLSEKEITKEASQDWNTHISYAEDGTVVEIVVLEASKQGHGHCFEVRRHKKARLYGARCFKIIVPGIPQEELSMVSPELLNEETIPVFDRKNKVLENRKSCHADNKSNLQRRACRIHQHTTVRC